MIYVTETNHGAFMEILRFAGRTVRTVFAGAALLAALPAAAERTITELELHEVDDLPSGKMAMVEGTASAEGDRFTLPDVSIFQPVAVSLIAQQPDSDIKFRLGKFGWDENFGGGSTKGSGIHTEKFRTQGDLLISVNAPSGAGRYALVIWAGDEIKPEMEPVLVPASQAGGSWTKYLLWLLGALALGGAAFYLGRRGKGKTA